MESQRATKRLPQRTKRPRHRRVGAAVATCTSATRWRAPPRARVPAWARGSRGACSMPRATRATAKPRATPRGPTAGAATATRRSPSTHATSVGRPTSTRARTSGASEARVQRFRRSARYPARSRRSVARAGGRTGPTAPTPGSIGVIWTRRTTRRGASTRASERLLRLGRRSRSRRCPGQDAGPFVGREPTAIVNCFGEAPARSGFW